MDILTPWISHGRSLPPMQMIDGFIRVDVYFKKEPDTVKTGPASASIDPGSCFNRCRAAPCREVNLMREERQEFMERVNPHLDTLMELARHELGYHLARGDVEEGDLTAEEIVGETLIAAYRQWKKQVKQRSWRSWLLGLESRVMHRLVDEEEKNRSLWAFSLEEPVPDLTSPFGDDIYWDWHQPDEQDRLEDVLLGFEPIAEDLIEQAEEVSRQLEPVARRVWLLHEMYDISIPEAARITGIQPSEAAKIVRETGKLVRERLDLDDSR